MPYLNRAGIRPKRFRNIVGPAIRLAREDRGLTQEQLAAKLGVAGLHAFDRVTVAKIEARIRSVYDYELALVARVLKVEAGYLMPARKALEADLPALLRGTN